MVDKPLKKCPKCGYLVMDEDVAICKNCNAILPNYDSRWDTHHHKKGPLIPTY